MSDMIYVESAYFKEHPKSETINAEDWKEELWSAIDMCIDEEIIDAICEIGTTQPYSAEEIAQGIKIWEEQNGINRSDTR